MTLFGVPIGQSPLLQPYQRIQTSIPSRPACVGPNLRSSTRRQRRLPFFPPVTMHRPAFVGNRVFAGRNIYPAVTRSPAQSRSVLLVIFSLLTKLRSLPFLFHNLCAVTVFFFPSVATHGVFFFFLKVLGFTPRNGLKLPLVPLPGVRNHPSSG